MGWATGTNMEGRDIGYGIPSECDWPGCTAQIDRGLGYVCGDMHDGYLTDRGEELKGCGKYFCSDHQTHWSPDWEADDSGCHQVCLACHDRLDAEHDLMKEIEWRDEKLEEYEHHVAGLHQRIRELSGHPG